MFGAYFTPALRARMLGTDVEALRALSTDRASLEDVLPTMRLPCLLFAGDADPRFARVQQCASGLPEATFFALPGCGHIAACARSDLVLPHLKRFLDRLR